MPAVVTGTVVRWEVVPEGEQKKPRVRFKDAKDVSVYVVDEDAEASAIAPAIIAKYILENNHARRAGRSRTSQATTATTTTTPPATPTLRRLHLPTIAQKKAYWRMLVRVCCR